MKVISYITPKMRQMDKDLRFSCIEYERKLSERGYYVREKRILTATIVLYVIEFSHDGKSNCSGWGYYPITGCENFIGSTNTTNEREKDDFTEIWTDRLLQNHNWKNPDIETAIIQRKSSVIL